MDGRRELGTYIPQQLGVALGMTARCGAGIRRALVSAGLGTEGGGLRITAQHGKNGTEFKFTVEAQPDDGDYVIEQHGARVYVDPFSAADLDGGAIDFVPAGDDHVFSLTAPKAGSRGTRLVA